MYVKIKDNFNTIEFCIKRLADNAFIPQNITNRDYQEYLDWIASGNTAEYEQDTKDAL